MALAAIFAVKNRWRDGVLLIGAMGGDTLIVALSKILIMSQRPLNEAIYATGYSFPSGHVAGCVVFFGILMYFAWKNWDSARTKSLASGLYIGVIVVVDFDRIYLNLHWFSDVVGGILLGAFWLVFTL